MLGLSIARNGAALLLLAGADVFAAHISSRGCPSAFKRLPKNQVVAHAQIRKMEPFLAHVNFECAKHELASM